MYIRAYEMICLRIVGAVDPVSSRDNPSQDWQMFNILNLQHRANSAFALTLPYTRLSENHHEHTCPR